jgi:hypothetical protein
MQKNGTVAFEDSEVPLVAVAGGNVYVAASLMGTADVDPGPGTHYVTDNFVVKLTTGGAFVWADEFQGTRNGSSGSPTGLAFAGIATDGWGNVYANGSVWGTVDFDPAPNGKNGQGQQYLTGAAYPVGTPFIVKLNASGSLAWAKQEDYGGSMAVDAAGAVYLAGSFTGTVDFDPGAGVANRTSAGGSDAFVVKLDTNGNFQWAVTAGGTGDDSAGAIAVDGLGDLYVAGGIAAGTADFDPANIYLDNRDLVTTSTTTGFLWQITQP